MTARNVWETITRKGKRPLFLELRSSVTFIILMVSIAVFTVGSVWNDLERRVETKLHL